MKVNLIHHTPLHVCATAISQCHANQHLMDTTICEATGDSWDENGQPSEAGERDRNYIDRVGMKMKHSSVLNHVHYVFEIKGISTKTLLALTRHDIGTEFTVQSTRYTTNKKLGVCTKTEDEGVNEDIEQIMNIVKRRIELGAKNDDVAMMLPQAYQYNLVCTFSMQALMHFLQLREAKGAHYDIRELAVHLRKAIPQEHGYLFRDRD